jgi:hypothetical protein
MVLDGCPMFASAYMGRKRQGEAPSNASAKRAKKTTAKSKNGHEWSESI